MTRQIKTVNETIREAWEGAHGPDQERIVKIGFELIAKLLRKNTDYGGSVFEVPALAAGRVGPGDGILVRMSDKMSRLNNILAGGGSLDSEGQVGESLADTLDDLLGYWILYQSRPGVTHDERELPPRDRSGDLFPGDEEVVPGLVVPVSTPGTVFESCVRRVERQPIEKLSTRCVLCKGEPTRPLDSYCDYCREVSELEGVPVESLSVLVARNAREIRELGRAEPDFVQDYDRGDGVFEDGTHFIAAEVSTREEGSSDE